jgi:integrase
MKMTDKPTRRAYGSGSIYQRGAFWWISYHDASGTRVRESSHGDERAAKHLLKLRNGAVQHNLPIVKNAERVTFNQAADAFLNSYWINHPGSRKTPGKVALHLLPYFGGRMLAGITTADVEAFKTHRLTQGIVRNGQRVADVSNAEVNRELALLRRIFNLAIEQERIARRPKVAMLKESAPRSGFFEREQLDAVLRHLPDDVQPVIKFAYETGWRVASEVLPLEWRQVDFDADEVRLLPGTTKNGRGRVFVMTAALRSVLLAQQAKHAELRQSGRIVPYVFFRMVADGRGGEKSPRPIVSFGKAWKSACRAAGLPGKIPHDLRRTAVRNLVRAGVSEQVAMRMTGHLTPSVFRRYDIVSDGDLREAARKLDRAAR